MTGNAVQTEFYNWGKKVYTASGFDYSLLSSESCKYSHRLAEFSSLLTMTAYNLLDKNRSTENSGMKKSLVSMGMENSEIIVDTKSSEVDVVMADREMKSGRRKYRLVILCLVGSHHGQWYDNFDCGPGDIHRGFAECRDFVLGRLDKYLEKNCADAGKMKFLITGHSRGGAVAGLVAKNLIDSKKYAKASDIYTYAFASPAYCRSADTADKKYSGIFNILNSEDFVTRCMPAEWGYGRYGVSYFIPDCRNSAGYKNILRNMNTFYSVFTGGMKFTPYRNGPDTVGRLIDTLADNVHSVEEYYGKKFRIFGEDISLQQFFTRSLCAVTAEAPGSEKYNAGVSLLLKTSAVRPGSPEIFRAVADFFVLYEGLAGVTKGKIFKNHFSSTHDMCTYCAFVLATSGKLPGGEKK